MEPDLAPRAGEKAKLFDQMVACRLEIVIVQTAEVKTFNNGKTADCVDTPNFLVFAKFIWMF
jgi:hypothetical protein